MEELAIQQVTESLCVRLGPDATAERAAGVFVSVCDQLAVALVPIVGRQGFIALVRRALHKASSVHPWLLIDDDSLQVEGLPGLGITIAAQPPADAIAGGTAFIREFCELLSSLLGPSLTERLLRPVWAHSSSGSPEVQPP